CFGPNQGRSVTFVHPGKWTGSWQSVEPYPSALEIVRRYLRAYGPATPENFAHWWDGGTGLVTTRKLFRSLEDELVQVEIEGRPACALRDTLENLSARRGLRGDPVGSRNNIAGRLKPRQERETPPSDTVGELRQPAEPALRMQSIVCSRAGWPPPN
ncbi:MAG: hypothetical protein EHM21_10825, partial [Chloroflexi bacterium]